MTWKNKLFLKLLYTLTSFSGLLTLSIFFYPTISDAWNRFVASRIIYKHIQDQKNNTSEDAIYQAAIEYNDILFHKGTVLSENARHAGDPYYESMLNENHDSIMGSVEIDCIQLSLPIYHYTSEEVLEKGVGHFYGSSLPVGGDNSHAVLTGHSGLMSARLFTELDQLDIGDYFKIHLLSRTLYYQIDQIKTVLPGETEDLAITEGKDLVTLVTCTPYGINTHRLLVRGHRVHKKQLRKYKMPVDQKMKSILREPALIFTIVILVILFYMILLVRIWR